MKNLLIVGAGELEELAVSCGYDKIGFLDDNAESALGRIDEYKKFTGDFSEFIVAVGNPEVRKKVVSLLEGEFKLATLIHSSAYVSNTATIGAGCIVEACSVVNTGSVLGKCSFVNAGAVVNHNSTVGEYSQIDCNAVVAARANVPEGTKVLSCTVWNEKPKMPVGDGTFF